MFVNWHLSNLGSYPPTDTRKQPSVFRQGPEEGIRFELLQSVFVQVLQANVESSSESAQRSLARVWTRRDSLSPPGLFPLASLFLKYPSPAWFLPFLTWKILKEFEVFEQCFSLQHVPHLLALVFLKHPSLYNIS